MTKWNIHVVELIAIWSAVGKIQDSKIPTQAPEDAKKTETTFHETKTYTSVSDSQSALKSIIKRAVKSGQTIVRRILDEVKMLKTQHILVRLFWVPGHANNPGNEATDQLAKQAVTMSEDHYFRTPLSAFRKEIHQKIERELCAE